MNRKKISTRGSATLVAAAAVLGADGVFSPNLARAGVISNATFNATVETTGAFGTTGTSFQAAGNTANTNTPSDTFPAFGAVAFNASAYTSLAGSGVDTSATLHLTEFISTSSSTGTHTGSAINFYFAENPQTTVAGLGDYDTNNTPGGFDAATFSADLVGSTTYANTANNADAVAITLTPADVSYINGVLTGGSGTFEFFAVATNGTDSARYDGTFATSPATLTLNAAVPEPASALLIGSVLAPLVLSRRRVNRRAGDATA